MRISTRSMGRTFGILSLLLILLLAVAACGGGSGNNGDDSAADRDAFGGDSGSGQEEAFFGDDGEFDDMAEDEAGIAAPQSGAGSVSYVANQVPFEQLVIRTVSLTLTVDNVADGVSWVRELALRQQGSVFSSNTYVRGENEFAQMTIRVPSEALDATVRELREHELVIQVDSEESSSQDVSQEYVDNEARVDALEETQRRFLALLSEADTVEEILRIESELTNIRSQIETIKGRQNYLDAMTSMSTVTVTMHVEDEEIEPDDDDGDGFIARVFGDSWDASSGVIEDILSGTVTVAIIGVVLLPFFAVAFLFVRLVYRRANEKWGTRPVATPPAVEPEIEPVS